PRVRATATLATPAAASPDRRVLPLAHIVPEAVAHVPQRLARHVLSRPDAALEFEAGEAAAVPHSHDVALQLAPAIGVRRGHALCGEVPVERGDDAEELIPFRFGHRVTSLDRGRPAAPNRAAPRPHAARRSRRPRARCWATAPATSCPARRGRAR